MAANKQMDVNLLQGSYRQAFDKWANSYRPVMAPLKTDLSKTAIGREVSQMPIAPPAVRFPYGKSV
jgi:hypothetical protein